MATLQQIKRRIGSVKNTQKITKAMKMVAAAQLRRSQEKLINARPYAYKLREVLANVSARVDRSMHPLLDERPPEKTAYIVVTADRGLCGGFNGNVIRKAETVFQDLNPEMFDVFCVGKKGFDYFKRRDYNIGEHVIQLFDQLDYSHAQLITDKIIEQYIQKNLDRVEVIYNEFKSAGSQRIVVEQLLPMKPDKELMRSHARNVDYEFEPDPLKLLDTVVPLNVAIQIWRILLESRAAEQGARMVAMENATNNAQDMIYALTLQYNRTRQAAITKEISEIVGGAEALKG